MFEISPFRPPMSKKKDLNIRRSSRISTKRGNKINYKEIEDGKEFSQDDDSLEQDVQKGMEKDFTSSLKKKDGKL